MSTTKPLPGNAEIDLKQESIQKEHKRAAEVSASHKSVEPKFTEVDPRTLITLIDEADEKFANIGGSNEQWLLDSLVPLLKERNIYLVTKS